MRKDATDARGHAIVIGASIAGLCAARVLADFYDRVTVFDRDHLPGTPASRSAVPQDRHLHLLTARGAQELDYLFPGLLADMVSAGVPMLENRPDCIHFGAVGHLLGTERTLRNPFTAYVPTRPHLEWQIRHKVAAIANIEVRRRAVTEPRFDADTQRVTGVLLGDGDLEFVAADLVVDAGGRGSRLPVWMEQWGYRRPAEQVIDVGICYASHWFRIPDGLIRQRVVVSGASREQPLGLGMLGCEGGVWVLTTFGVAKAEPPRTFPEMIALAEKLLPANFTAALEQAEPVGDVAIYRFPTSRWRRYDQLDRHPAGIIPFGDAVASLNPTYGTGITVAALQAHNLRDALSARRSNVSALLRRAATKTIHPVWATVAVADFTFHDARGPARWWYRPVGNLFDQLLGAAETDPVVAEWFLRRYSLLDSLWMVPPATLVARTVRHNMRLWLSERRQMRRDRRRSRQAAPNLTAADEVRPP